MLTRNYIELGIIAAVVLCGLVAFCILRHKAARYESELHIQTRGELRGKLN